MNYPMIFGNKFIKIIYTRDKTLTSCESYTTSDIIPKEVDISDKFITNVEKQKKLLQIEKQLIDNNICSLTTEIDIDLLDKLFDTHQVLISDFHDTLFCQINSVILNENPALYEREKAKHFFTISSKIEKSTWEGFIFKPNNNSLFVIKTPNGSSNDNLIHETFIGTFALNKLKKYIPNFMYVYGYFNCSPMIVDKEKPITWCSSSSENNVNYIILENVRDSISLNEWILVKDRTSNDFLAVFYQILNALNMAYIKYDYTHYDLHTGNILIKEFKENLAIPFYNQNGNIDRYIVTKYVPYIIDYEYNHIRLFNEDGIATHFGPYVSNDFYKQSLLVSHPANDIYKIICYCGQHSYFSKKGEANDVIKNIVNNLYDMFDEGITLEERINRRISDRRNDYYNVEKSKYNTYYDFIVDILPRIQYDFVYLMDKFINDDTLFIDICENINNYNVESNSEISAFNYCQQRYSIDEKIKNSVVTKEIGDNMKSKLNRKYDLSKIFKHDFDIINLKISSIDKLFKRYFYFSKQNIIMEINKSGILVTDLYKLNRDKLKNRFFIQSYTNAVKSLLIIKEELFNITSLVGSIICVINYNDKNLYKSEINKIYNFIDEYRDILLDLYDILMNNAYRIIDKINSDSNDFSQLFWKRNNIEMLKALL